MNAGTLTPNEIAEAVKRCDRRRRRPWVIGGVVFVIILLLALVAELSGPSRVTLKAKKSTAQSAAVAIINAIDQWHTDYDFLPMPTSAVKGQDIETDSTAEEGLILILKGMDLTGSTRNTDYLGDFKDAKTLSGGKRVDGLVRDGETIALVDPWGRPYLIRLDGNVDGYVEDPENPGTMLHTTAIVWSAGKDGDEATWDDNVKSWDIAR